MIRACLTGETDTSDLVTDAVNRRGRPVVCKVTATPLLGPHRDIRGVILMMEDQEPATGAASGGSA